VKKEVTITRTVCDYCEMDLGLGQWEHNSKCVLCGKDVCLKHSATIYFADMDSEESLLICREHLPEALFHIKE